MIGLLSWIGIVIIVVDGIGIRVKVVIVLAVIEGIIIWRPAIRRRRHGLTGF